MIISLILAVTLFRNYNAIRSCKYDLDFEYADIFNYPTIRQLAKKLPSPENHLWIIMIMILLTKYYS